MITKLVNLFTRYSVLLSFMVLTLRSRCSRWAHQQQYCVIARRSHVAGTMTSTIAAKWSPTPRCQISNTYNVSFFRLYGPSALIFERCGFYILYTGGFSRAPSIYFTGPLLTASYPIWCNQAEPHFIG
jgi:hypothetical protein